MKKKSKEVQEERPDDGLFQALLEQVVTNDVKVLLKKDKEYGSSWKKRGGTGAFMMLARKWDRLETQVSSTTGRAGVVVSAYDIFEHAMRDDRVEGVLDDIQDLRRYLILVEAELIRLGHGEKKA